MSSATSDATEGVSATSDATEGVKPDIYGQYHPAETPELIERKQKEFDEEVSKVPDKDKEDVLEAQKKCPELLTPAFKLMFLRSEVFRVDKAVTRYCSYWKRRVEIFGPDKAFKPLTVENSLSEDMDRSSMEMNAMNLYEANGRMVLFINPANLDREKYTVESFLRCQWYMIHAALENEETQKKGLILMPYGKNIKMKHFNRKLLQGIMEGMRGSLPMRFSADHICHPPAIFNVIFPMMSLFMSELMRKRVLLHRGSEAKVLERLSKYGFSKETLPKELGGDLAFDAMTWLDSRKKAGL